MAPDSSVFGRNLLFRLVQFAELVVPNEVFLVQKRFAGDPSVNAWFGDDTANILTTLFPDRHWTEGFRTLALMLNLPVAGVIRPLLKRFSLTLSRRFHMLRCE